MTVGFPNKYQERIKRAPWLTMGRRLRMSNTSITSSLPPTQPIGMPPPMTFPQHVMSGVTP